MSFNKKPKKNNNSDICPLADFLHMPFEISYKITDIYFKNLMKEYKEYNTFDKLKIVYEVMTNLKLAIGKNFNINRYQLKKYNRVDSLDYITKEVYRTQEINEHNRIPWFISLDLSGLHSLSEENETKIYNFLKENKCYAVNLSNTQLSTLKIRYINDLNLSGCTGLNDVSALGGVHTLNLSRCPLVSYVSELGGVHTLNLSRCPLVWDVSELGRVHDLNLSYTNIENVSALGGVHTLNLSGCLDVVDVSALGRVHDLDLSYTNIENVSELGRGGIGQTLDLSGCQNLLDVSALGRVHTLQLSGCRNIWDASALGRVHDLDLSYTNIKNVSALGRGIGQTLNLSGCESVWDVSALGGVHTLQLSDCQNIRDVSALGGVHTLDLSYCRNIRNVSALGGVHTLDLSYTNIIDLSALGGVHNLHLSWLFRSEYIWPLWPSTHFDFKFIEVMQTL